MASEWLYLVDSHLSLYMDSEETYKLLGITAELSYVRNGIINHHALSFNLPVATEINEIHFTWQSTKRDSMPYKMQFFVSNPQAMNKPTANISNNGLVPTKLSVFKVKLPCTNLLNAEVDVNIQMNISIFSSSNWTGLNFKRRKICRKDPTIGLRSGSSYSSDPHSFFAAPSDSDKVNNINSSTYLFYIAVGCACVIILLIALAVTAYYLNSQKASAKGYADKMSDTSSSQALTQQSQTFLRADTPNNTTGSGLPNFRHGICIPMDTKGTDPRLLLEEISIERNRITLGEILLEGTFGQIYCGTIITEDEKGGEFEQEVFIKTITDQARSDQTQVFLQECCMLKGLIHENINPVLAACLTPPDQQPLIVFHATSEGNLKKFLQKCRMSECGSHYALNTQQLVYMAIQIIRGVQFLHRKKIVHKDLATRNCLVDSDLGLKITDNSLSRDLFPNDYNCLGDNENRPVKWLSIEALLTHRFSPASDVWAFGVTLWELMTLGQQPYADIDPFEMSAYLQEGYRIAQPINCPDELFSVMACCWAISFEERPKFSQLLVCLQDFYTALGRYI
ncbi:tyrosineRYK-like,protein kinase RYK-like [Octopus vulgaris]|uniref:receptor protein-tyrosine kinase n=1 Tax=Octopus vulgaris TaxID=6645 RepID=A0AA36FFV6_OCTVU|nr:tyrosineRYK-like,protein kinase RYK-like [Octopus vulgaris]